MTCIDRYMSVRLPDDHREFLQRCADRVGLTRTEVLRKVLEHYLASSEIPWDEYIADYAQAKRVKAADRADSQWFRNYQIRRKRLLEGFVERIDRQRVFETSGGVCGICHDPLTFDDMAVDHIIPLARGGAHSYANVQATHRLCNAKKWAH